MLSHSLASLPVSFPTNYPEEAFYYPAQSEMTTGSSERARLVLALEVAFVNDAPRIDALIVFGRVRIRISGLQPNTEYTVKRPCGVEKYIAELDPGGPKIGELNFTEVVGVVNGSDFHLALNSRAHSFLHRDPDCGT